MAEWGEWIAYVRERLPLTGLEETREAEIVEDVARQLEDAYRDAILAGAGEPEARRMAQRHVADWDALARQLSASVRQRQPAIDRWSAGLDDRAAARGRVSGGGRLRQDVVHGWRALRAAPAILIIAVLSLALGIGANTALFSVIRALMLRPLQVPDAGALVALTDPEVEGVATGIEDGARSMLSYHEFEGLRADTTVLTGLLAFGTRNLRAPIAIESAAESAPGSVSLVSGEYFPVLGVAPAQGRTFGIEVDAARLAHPIAVVSDRFWRTRLHADPRVVGRTIQIRRTNFEIAGVMPPTFTGLVVGRAPDLWVPLTMQEAVAPGRDWLTQPTGTARRTMFLHVVGRLKPGVSLDRANVVLTELFRRNLEAEAAQIADADRRRALVDAHLVVRSAAHGLSPLRAEYAQPLAVLMALVGLLLLLACANIANLLLARATGRERELAMRVALGASRARLVRQLLTESLMLAALGAAVGLIVAYWGDRLLLRLVSGGPAAIPLETPLDGPVLAFAGIVTLATGLLFGLAPALRATRVDMNVVLRGTAATIAGASRWAGRIPVGKVLAAAQVAISLLLLIAAGLFVRSLQRLGDVPLGYDATGIVLFRLSPTVDGYTPATVDALFADLLGSIGRAPGVQSVTLSSNGLFEGSELGSGISFPGFTAPPGVEMATLLDLVGPRYFSTIGIPILLGRDVTAADSAGLPGCWVNQSAARYFFGDDSPIGRRVVTHFSFGDAEFEIRGVVADARANSVRDDIPGRFYLPYFGSVITPASAVFAVRTDGDAAAIGPEVRRVLRETDTRLSVSSFWTVPELLGDGLARDRLTAQLSSLFSTMALTMAAIGLYGVLSYSVGRRVGEIGVRLALGARPGRIVGLIVREALTVTLIGAAVGLAAAFAAARLLETMLFSLSPRDPVTFAGAAAVLLVVAAAAAAVPAARAAHTDPLRALRSE